MKTSKMLTVLPFLSALAAGAAYSGRAEAKVAVMVVLDRSGSMAMPGSGKSCPHTADSGVTDTRWACAINGLRQRLSDMQLTGDDDVYFYKFSTRYLPAIFEWNNAAATDPQILKYMGGPNLDDPFAANTILTVLGDQLAEGPGLFDDSVTPLAGAYCRAAGWLAQHEAGLPQNERHEALVLQLGTDGLENATPTTDLCYGEDSVTTYGQYYTKPAYDMQLFPPYGLHDIGTETVEGGTVFNKVDGLHVPSWQSNLLDVAISGGVLAGGLLGPHVPAGH